MSLFAKLTMATAGATFITLGTLKTASTSAATLSQVQIGGTVTQIINLDPRIVVSVGDTLTGSFTYDPTVVVGMANPIPSLGSFAISPLSSFDFTVGSLSGRLDSNFGGFFTPGLIDEFITSFGTFFNTSDNIQLNGGNTFTAGGGNTGGNTAGSGNFFIGSSESGIQGTYQTSAISCSATNSN
jgi:hypothetical protein